MFTDTREKGKLFSGSRGFFLVRGVLFKANVNVLCVPVRLLTSRDARAIWLLALAAVLQGVLLAERVLFVVLCLALRVSQTPTKRLAAFNTIATAAMLALHAAAIPCRLALRVLGVLWSNALLTLVLVAMIGVLAVLAEMSGGFWALLLNMYNTGVGVTLQNEWVQPLTWLEVLLGGFLPLWNFVWYFPTMLVRYVLLPAVAWEPSLLQEMAGDSLLMTSAMAISASSSAQRIMQCATWDVPASTAAGLACIADTSYMHLDLMTPGIYARRLLMSVEKVLVAGCSAGNLVLAIVMYPLLDFNLYKALHCLVNAILNTLLAMPIATVQRCRYANLMGADFALSERTIMCMPDFSMSCSVVVGMVRALAQLVQNWADAALIVIERGMGLESALCKTDLTAETINTMWGVGRNVLGQPQTVVPLTATLLAVTDGESTVYNSLAAADTWHAVGNWPLKVDVRAGVAAVRHSREMDADDAASVRTGMLGCACVDVLVDSVPAVRIQCATVPFRNTDLVDFNETTLIQTLFYPRGAELLLTCGTIRLQVLPLRFSRRRMSTSFGSGGGGADRMDQSAWRTLDAIGQNGLREPELYAADAAIYVQPECVGSGPGRGACVGEESCFPFCMGLHIAGQNGEAITLYHARSWQESVSVAQMDCVSMAPLSDAECDARVTSTSMADGFADGACALATECVASDVVVTRVPITDSAGFDALREQTRVTQRLQAQPFVVAGDVLLFESEDRTSVEVVRLYNSNNGAAVLQNEHLTLGSTTQGVKLTKCETTSDTECYWRAVLEGKLVLPPTSASVTRGRSFPATSSEWGVHWAHNPDNHLLAGYFGTCQGVVATTFDFGEQFPHIWTLQSMRAPASSDERKVAYMLVPDWVGRDTGCNQMANVQVLALHHLNAQNVLVQVLRTTPANYDWLAGSVIDPDPKLSQTVFFYMHPNRHGCTDPESSELIYTCWRTAAEGIFPDDDAPLSVVLGTICPAARRTPSLGLAAGELVVAGVETVRLVIDAFFVLPAALAVDRGLSRVFALRLDRPAFHSTLDTSGAQLLSPEAVLDSIDRVAMYYAQTLLKVAALLKPPDNLMRVVEIRTIVVGTARLLQHTKGYQKLEGKALEQWQALQETPLAGVIGGIQNNLVGMAAGPGGQRLSALFSGMTSTLRVTAKLLQRILLRVLRATQTVFVISNGAAVIGAVFQDTFDDMKRGWFDPARAQCLGVADLFGGTTPVAVFLRDTCMSVPDGLEGMVNVILALLLDYPSMRCACVKSAAQVPREIIREVCLLRELPATVRVGLKRIAGGDAVNICFESMDAANTRLKTGFDRFFRRLYSAATGLGESLDWIVSFWDKDAGECYNFESPYVVTLIPEPSDYFMLCTDTSTCRAKCLDEMEAFETARELVPMPSFVAAQTVTVSSRFFSVSDVENERHLAPFEVLALSELESCAQVCASSKHPRDRCVVAAGLSENALAVAYYCVPADIMRFVTPYAGLAFPVAPQYAPREKAERVDNVYLLTTDGVERGVRETLLVLSRNAADGYDRLELVQASGRTTTLLRTQIEPFAGRMHSVQLVRVVPQGRGQAAPALVLVRGQVFQWKDGEVRPRPACQRLAVDAWSEQMPEFELTDFACSDVFSTVHADTCLAADCSRVLRLPLMGATGAERAVQVLLFDDRHERVLSRTEAPGAEQVAATLHMQKSMSVYRTMAHETAVNARHVAGRTSTNGTLTRVCVLLSGVVDRREAWLQNLCVDLSSGTVSVGPAEPVLEAVNVAVACELHSCAGCQSVPKNDVFNDLQAKCFLASRCAVARCVGTAVNIRRPLCNMGALLTDVAEEALILSQGIWDALSNTIVVAVEITGARREEYVLAWPEQAFQAQVCHAKDMLLEAVSTLTSIVGGADSLAEQKNYDRAGELSSVMDARYHARRIMATTAVTSLISSILMAPLFGVLALRKTISCSINDVFIIIESLVAAPLGAVGNKLGVDLSPPRVLLGSQKFMKETSAVVGSCVTEVVHGLLRNMDNDEGLNGVGRYLSDLLGDITRMTALRPLEPVVHIFDAIISYLLGVTTATESLIATVDWRHCRPPVAAMADTSRCVCGDVAHSIPAGIKRQNYASSAFWCSGPLLMTTATGQEVLIWNPFSLDELLELAASFDAFILCMKTATNCPRPQNAILEDQGVELMQVVTQCRANYQARAWDAGAVLMGVLTLEEWEMLANLSPSALQALWAKTDDAYTGIRRRWARLSEYMGGWALPDDLWSCLRSALEDRLWRHPCLEQHLLREGLSSTYEYFVYERSTSTRFVDTDACQSFSGDATAFADNGAAHAPSIWSSSSSNTLPVAEYHYKLSESAQNRAQLAEEQLQALHARIVKTLRDASYTLSKKVDVKAESREGDQLHQIMDCFMLGPYAAADMHATFETGGTRFPVPQYHRGSPRSRLFMKGPATGGSDVRQSVMAKFLEGISSQVDDQVRATVASTLNRWRSVMSDIDNLRCGCGDNRPRSMACCSFTSRAHITYPARDLQLDTDIGDQVLQQAVNNPETQKMLGQIWTSREFLPPRTPLSAGERVQMRDAYAFDYTQRVLEYSVDETPEAIGERTLWEQCTALLSASFFTLPLRQLGGLGGLATELEYDPTRDAGTGYLHGMEEMIERVLNRAWEHSPVFWSHVHRYVASDSVWCEDTDAAPAPPAQATSASPAAEWFGLAFGEDRILAPALASTRFPADARCLCGWVDSTDGTMCRVPSCELEPAPAQSWPLLAAWTELCNRKKYNTRDQLFLLLEVLQQFQLRTEETCLDVVPSVVWGLLDTRQQRQWYAGEPGVLGLDLQELASNGAAGIRLGLLKKEGSRTLLQFLQEQALLQPVRSYVNTKYKHTVAQPVCRRNLHDALHSDLSRHFADVFFPVAHSVHEAPVAAVCSRWAVEFAVLGAMRLLRNSSQGSASNIEQDRLDRQQDTTSAWRARCHVQLQQVGICALRGVLDLKPANWDDNAQNCSFKASAHGCTQLFYVTSGCLVMCDGVVYDPCLCAGDLCDGFEFKRQSCTAGEVTDIRKWTTDETVRLYSMHWPDELRPDETGGDARWKALNDELQRVRLARAAAPLVDDAALFEAVRGLVLEQAAGVQEGAAPAGFCDDMADYMPADAQHPVGYHPTCACTRAETNMRGFGAWMSAPVDSNQAWAVDPVRWRNMSSYSTVFGSAHLVCDAVAYTMDERALNAYHLTSRWDPTETSDPAMPTRTTTSTSALNNMLALGANPGQSERDHPCQPGQSTQTDDAFLHSVGLVRDWFSCYVDDSTVPGECPLPAAWPHNPRPADYTLPPQAPATCPHPRLTRCREANDCRVYRNDLVCQKPWDDDLGAFEDEGICARQDTCFQHKHCAEGEMCAGTGECVRPRVYVRNELPVKVDVQLFSHDREHCTLDAAGFSSHQIVDDFAQAHGLCQFRNWYHYQGIMRNSTRHNLLGHVSLNHVLQRTDDVDRLSLRERGVLRQAPHACDRSYQHTAMRLCRAPVAAWYTFQSTPAPDPIPASRSMRTWQDGEARFCTLAGRPRTGFLNPYRRPDDSLQYVPNDIRLCHEFKLCPEIKFLVQGRAVERRYTDAGPYGFADLQTCGPAGRLAGDAGSRCVVDRLVVPALDWVFSHPKPGQKVDAALPTDPAYRVVEAKTAQWSPAAMRDKLDEIKKHCPHAFNGDLNLYQEYIQRLAFSYPASQAGEVSEFANRLLLQLFGIGDDPLETHRGFDSIHAYRALAVCAEYVLERLDAVREFNRDSNVYTIEKLWEPLVPGTSVYLFRGLASVYVPWKWFWQCVVASRASDGGAPANWLRRLEDVLDPDVDAETLVCDNFERPPGPGLETVALKLQRAAALYEFETAQFAGTLMQDIDAVLHSGLDAMQISIFPDTYCVGVELEPEKAATLGCSSVQPALSMTAGSCTYKTGRDIAADINDTLWSPADVYNIMRVARSKILGAAFVDPNAFFEANIDMFTRGDDAPLDIILDVSDRVDAAWNYIPRVSFPKAMAWLAGSETLLATEVYADPYYLDEACPRRLTTQRARAGASVDSDTEDAWSNGLRRLAQPEFHVRAQSNLLELANIPDTTRFLSTDRACFLLVRYFVRAIQTQGFFRAGSMTPTAQSQSQMYDPLDREDWTGHVKTALTFADFMQTKQFDCSEDNSYKAQVENNDLHRSLRACVRELHEDTGWQLPGASTGTASTRGNVLQIDVPAAVLLQGFLPVFTEARAGRAHLDELFSSAWAERVDPRLAVCGKDGRGAYVLNPYWAGMFDRVTGCDVRALGEPGIGLREVDGACATFQGDGNDANDPNDETCAQRFPGRDGFDAALHGPLGMPRTCTDMYEAGTVFSPPLASGFAPPPAPGYTPLCQRVADRPEECALHHGTLLNSRGAAVLDLLAEHGSTTHAGIWSEDNTIMREELERTVGSNDIVAGLRVLASDIAGHALLFGISADGQMRLQCLYLDKAPEDVCAHGSSSLLSRSPEFWAWQDALLRQHWPPASNLNAVDSNDWHCPLAWLAAYSDARRLFAARSPNPLRNEARFRHITGNRLAHPTVHSSDKMPFLTAGRFLSETLVCTDPDVLSPACRGEVHLRQTLTQLRSPAEWYHVQYLEQKACIQLLDWPHQDYRLADHIQKPGDASEQQPCNVYGRLPRFALRRTQRAVTATGTAARLWPRAPPILKSTPHSPTHACRMGRLPRVSVAKTAVDPPAQYCSVRSNILLCETWTKGARNTTSTPLRPAAPPTLPRQPATRRRRRCAACEDHAQGAFVDRRGQSTVLNTPRPQLSVGQAMALHPARMIAQFLRKAVCKEALKPCPALLAFLTDEGVTPGQGGAQAFLARLLQPEPEGPGPAPQSTDQDQTDDALWARPWGFCDQSKQSRGCSGNLTRSAWLDPRTRGAQCAAMVTTADSVPAAPLELCLLDSTTEAMCRHMAEWRLAIDTIICQASGLAACPLYGFFYTPTRYSVENARFVHDTVREFYAALGKTCPDTPDLQAAQALQVKINKDALARCAAMALGPVRRALQQSRQIVTLVTEMLFYALQIFVEILNLLVAVISASPAAIPAIATRIAMYIGLFLGAIGQAWLEILNAFFQMMFSDGMPRELVDLARSLCYAMNFIHKYVIQKGLCVLLDVIVQGLHAMADAFEKIPLVGKGVARPFRGWANMLAGLSICGESQLNCEALRPPQTDKRPSTLTYPTRCWSTYATFFGDTQSLSCSPADTCAPTMGQTSNPVMCGECPLGLTGVLKFACAPETKMCTCSVATITQSMCLSNAECQDAGRNCRYLNSMLEPAAGSTACATCQTPPVCLLQPDASTGFCACPLRHTEFAECRKDQLGQDVFPDFGSLCLFSNAIASSMTYSVVVDDVMARRCDDLLAAGAVCSAAAGQGYFVLGHAARGRRLLQDRSSSSRSIHTLSPLCADALSSLSRPGLPMVRAACERAHDLSERTLRELGLSGRVPACALCSIEDALAALREHPQLALRVLLHPGHASAVLLRHTPARHALAALRTLQDSVHVLAMDLQDMMASQVDMPPLLLRFLRFLNATWGEYNEHNTSNSNNTGNTGNTGNITSARRLLGVAGISKAFEEMLQAGNAYKNQLHTGWDYVYPNLVHGRDYNPWLDKVWPPFSIVADPEKTCSTGGLFLETLQTTTESTAAAYRSRPPRPPATLRWFSVPKASASSSDPASDPASASTTHAPDFARDKDWATWGAVWASRHVLAAFGVTPTGVYDGLVALTHELADLVHCDFEAVQTCSRWSMRLVNGIIIVASVQFIVVAVFFACGAPALGLASTVLFIPGVFWTCYGYSPTCIPLVPSCLVRDLVETLQDLVPNYILLPSSMLRPGCAMTQDNLLLRDDCVVPCSEPPFAFEDAGAVVAWISAELGLVRWLDGALEHVLLLDVAGLRAQLWLKHGVATHGSEGLVLGHRLCAAVSAYKLLPYLFIGTVLVVLLFAVVSLLLDLGLAVGTLVTSVAVTVFTE